MTDYKPITADELAQQPPAKRGGARPGAGRKRGSGNGLVSKIQVCVTPQQKTCYEKLGAAKWLRSYLNGEVISSQLEHKNVVNTDRLPETAMLAQGSEINEDAQVAFADHMDDGSKITAKINLNEYLIGNNAKTVVIPSGSDDMRLAGIVEGDLLIVDRMATPEDGDLVLIHRKGVYVPRRFKYIKSRRIELHTERSKSKDRVIALRKDSDFSMVGVITGVVRKTR